MYLREFIIEITIKQNKPIKGITYPNKLNTPKIDIRK